MDLRIFYISLKFTFIIVLISFPVFSQNNSIPYLKLASPNGGEKWEANADYEIKWESEAVSNIKIEYSIDNGLSWNLISFSFPAFSGKYNWLVPNINSSQVAVRIYDVTDNSISDSSNSLFSIGSSTFLKSIITPSVKELKKGNPKVTAGTLTLDAPAPTSDGGTVWNAGTYPTISWTGSGIASVDIDYSLNGGVNWTNIATGAASSGSYSAWPVPSTPTTELVIRVKESGGSITAQNSHYVFIKSTQSFSTPVKILPYGNSITFGTNANLTWIGNTGDRTGYEYNLWNLLRTDNYNFDLIGSEYSGYNYFPDYQKGGFPGATISQLKDILEIGKNTKFSPADIITYPSKYLNVYTPDIVLLHVGTNIDGLYSTSTERNNTATSETNRINQMLNDIFSSTYNSNASNTWVILALILNCDASVDANRSDYYQILNNNMQAMANNRINNGDHILIIDMYNIPGFNYTVDGDLSDYIHPNSSGYDKMSQVWYNALKLILPSGLTASPGFSQSNIDTVAFVNIPFNYQAVATGVGGPTYSITSGPGTINQYTGKVVWTPSSVGEISMTINAANGTGSDNQNLTIHVLQEPSIPSDLVSYWRFDENKSSGPFINKYNVNNGFTQSSLTPTTGQVNGAYTFDGTDKVNILDQPDFDFQNSSFTVEAWIKRSSSGSGDRTVVGKYGRTNDENFWWLGINGSNQPTFFVHFTGAADKQITSSSSIAADTWVHIVGIKNGLSNIELYVNGVSKGSVSTGAGLNDDFNSYRPLNIGHWYNDKLFYGTIDEVAVYNGVLSSGAISSQYSRGVTYHEGYFDIHSSEMVFLQGPYSSGTMSTALNTGGYLPLSQPYGTFPWNYYGNESVSSVPAGVVDWVLVELRSTYNGSAVSRRAGFVTSDGTIVDVDGTSALDFGGTLPGNYYIVVRHRNHLAVMSSSAVTLPDNSYDFTTAQNKAYTPPSGPNPMIALGGGNYGMIAGDANSDGTVNAVDFNDYWLIQNGTPYSYNKYGDFNMDGTINAVDFNNYWLLNNGKATQLP